METSLVSAPEGGNSDNIGGGENVATGDDKKPKRSNEKERGSGFIDGQATAVANALVSTAWDVEEDHLLSYFLSGNDTNVGNQNAGTSNNNSGDGGVGSSSVSFPTGSMSSLGNVSSGSGHGAGLGGRNTGSTNLAVASSSPQSMGVPSPTIQPTVPQPPSQPVNQRASALRNRMASLSGNSLGSADGTSHGHQVTFMEGISVETATKRTGDTLMRSLPSSASDESFSWKGGQRHQKPYRRDQDVTPGTPALQFYAHTSSSADNNRNVSNNGSSKDLSSSSIGGIPGMNRILSSSSSSSNSSLASVAAALATGQGPQHVFQVHHQLQTKVSELPSPLPHTSPVSPATMIGVQGGEQMMLPPPPRLPYGGGVVGSGLSSNGLSSSQPKQPAPQPIATQWQYQDPNSMQQLPQAEQQQQQQQHSTTTTTNLQQHADWLQQMNNLAAMASQAKSALGKGSILPTQQQQQNQPASVTGPSFQSLPTVGGAPVRPIFQQPLLVQPLAPNPSPIDPNNPTQPQSAVGAQQQTSAPPAGTSTGMIFQRMTTAPPTTSAVDQIPRNPHTTQSQMPNQGANTVYMSTTTAATSSLQQQQQGENAERRARRLARNRESARQSRRRKKELLIKLGAKVNKLHNIIEDERRRRIGSMEADFAKNREIGIRQMNSLMSTNQQHHLSNNDSMSPVSSPVITASQRTQCHEQLTNLIRNSGPNCPPRRAVAAFQYNTLRNNLILPPYCQFVLWLTLRPDLYFTAGKDERAMRAGSKSNCRISSKQIGEELTQLKNHNKVSIIGKNSNTKRNGGGGNLTAEAHDGSRLWPLLCYELSLSVDQEERALQACKSLRENKRLSTHRNQLSIATTMASSLKTGVLFQSHSASHRNESALLQVLSPEQALNFLSWYISNRQRFRNLIEWKRKKAAAESQALPVDASSMETDLHKVSGNDQSLMNSANGTPRLKVEESTSSKEKSLNDICYQLEEALNIGVKGKGDANTKTPPPS